MTLLQTNKQTERLTDRKLQKKQPFVIEEETNYVKTFQLRGKCTKLNSLFIGRDEKKVTHFSYRVIN